MYRLTIISLLSLLGVQFMCIIQFDQFVWKLLTCNTYGNTFSSGILKLNPSSSYFYLYFHDLTLRSDSPLPSLNHTSGDKSKRSLRLTNELLGDTSSCLTAAVTHSTASFPFSSRRHTWIKTTNLLSCQQSFKVALGVSPQLFSFWTPWVLNHNQYVEI